MDTVKGYAVLKADYEKLIDEITSLDSERHELELALERELSKQGNAGKSSNVDKLQERFKKVNQLP